MKKKVKNVILAPFNILYSINPILEQKIMVRIKCGYNINLNNPVTYNEKLNLIES
jgi:hypothetical protein